MDNLPNSELPPAATQPINSGKPSGLSVARGSPPSVDITEDEGYQRFVESMVPHCHCAEQFRLCDGVLAGGLCDNQQDEENDHTWTHELE